MNLRRRGIPLLLVAAVTVTHDPATAQGRLPELRKGYQDREVWTSIDGTRGGTIALLPRGIGSAAALSVTAEEFDGQHIGDVRRVSESELDAPFDFIGGSQFLSVQSNDCYYLVSGYRSSAMNPVSPAGVLSVIKCTSGPSVVVDAQAEIASTDLLDAVWVEDAQMLIAVDGFTNTLLAAAWNGPGYGLPQSFMTIRNASQSPILLGEVVRLSVSDDLTVRLWDSDLYAGEEIKLDGIAPTFTPIDARSEPLLSPTRWQVTSNRFVPYDGQIDIALGEVSSPATWHIETDNLDGSVAVLMTGLHPGNGHLSVTPPSIFFFLPGVECRLRGGGLAGTILRPSVRYGMAVDAGELSWAQDLAIAPEFLFVGVEKHFGPSAVISSDLPSPTVLDAFLLVGVRDGAVDPIIPAPSGGVTISNPLIVPFQVEVTPGFSNAVARQRFDIPDLTGLEGAVLLFQILVVSETGQAAYTSVRASTVLGSDQNPAARLDALGGSPPAAARAAVNRLSLGAFSSRALAPARLQACSDLMMECLELNEPSVALLQLRARVEAALGR